MTRTMHGTVNDRTIELDEDPGVAEGQHVEITIKLVEVKRPWGEGLRRCAGHFPGSGLRKMTGFSSRSMRKGSGIAQGHT